MTELAEDIQDIKNDLLTLNKRCSLISKDYQEQNVERIKQIEHLKNCIKTQASLIDNTIHKSIEKLEEKVKKLEQAYHHEEPIRRTPYRCPVCDGKGSIQKEVEPKIFSFEACCACLCKRIVWG